MSAEILLAKLDKVKRTGNGTWIACCPAHADKGPSLSIRETEDGRVLVHDFAGCSVHEVLAAVGMEFSDLYPEPIDGHRKSERRPFSANDALRAVAFEALVVSAAASALLTGHPFSAADRERLSLAASRIQMALSAVMPQRRGDRHART